MTTSINIHDIENITISKANRLADTRTYTFDIVITDSKGNKTRMVFFADSIDKLNLQKEKK